MFHKYHLQISIFSFPDGPNVKARCMGRGNKTKPKTRKSDLFYYKTIIIQMIINYLVEDNPAHGGSFVTLFC